MAGVRVVQLRASLDRFAALLASSGALENGEALRELSKRLAVADKIAVDEFVKRLVAVGKGKS